MAAGVRRRLSRYAWSHPRRRVLGFLREPTRLLQRADQVVAMGGHNTVCEILSFGKPALIVPRGKPRREQLNRAARLSALRLLGGLHPHALPPLRPRPRRAPEAGAVRRARDHISLNGLGRLPWLVEQLLKGRPALVRARDPRPGVPRAIG